MGQTWPSRGKESFFLFIFDNSFPFFVSFLFEQII
jgi:hypothetical protein